MKKLTTLLILLLPLLTEVSAQYDASLAVPYAIGFDINNTNTVHLPFSISGGLDQPGKWRPNQSTVEGTFYITYNLSGRQGKYGQDQVKRVRVGLNGKWQMEGFALYPPGEAYNIEYRLAIFHFSDGKESAGRVYSITPDHKTIRKYGITKLASKPTIIAKPLPIEEFKRFHQKFEKVKSNPQPIPPKTVR